MAKKTEGSFFTKILILSAIFLGWVLTYSYIIWNAIQPQLWVVEKIYTWIFSSAETISSPHTQMVVGFDIDSHIEIKQEKSILLDSKLAIKNAQIYADKTGLEQSISADSIILNNNIQGKSKEYILDNLDIITQNENIYISAGKWLQNFSKLFWLTEKSNQIFEKISTINSAGKYAHISNAQPIQEVFSDFEPDHVIIQLITAFTTSNSKKYFENNNLWNLLKQKIYNDKWIEYFFEKNEKISDDSTYHYILNKEMCGEVTPFLELLPISQSWAINNTWSPQQDCERYIKDINPFIALVSQIYKQGDIEAWNYDFVISQGSQIDIRFKYSNHILQNWNIFIQNPENTVKISILWDKFGIKESQVDIDYTKNKSVITWNIVNGTWDISINIDEKNNQTTGSIILQNYLLVDMDVKARGETEKWDMRFLAQWDYKSGKIDYSVKASWEIIDAINIKYTDKNYKIDYVTPDVSFNSLYAKWKFIIWFSQKYKEDETEEISKEIKYVYDEGKIKWHYRTQEFEGNLEGEILSNNTFALELWIKQNNQDLLVQVEAKQVGNDIIEYTAEWLMQDEKLFSMLATHSQKEDISSITVWVEIPDENMQISFDVNLKKNNVNAKYTIPENIEKIEIDLDQIIPIINFHRVCDITWPEFSFAWASIAAAWWTMSYLSLRWDSREDKNNKIIWDIERINNAVYRYIETNSWSIQYRDFIKELSVENKDVWIRIGWDKIYPWDEYIVGTINYELFALDENIIERDDISYKIALLNKPELQQFQILGFLDEVGSKQRVITKWNYIPRKFVRYDFDIVVPDNNIEENKQTSIQIKIKGEHHLKVWDVTNLWRILDINNEVIFIENAVNPDISKVYLLWNDSPTLFINKNSAFEPWEIIIKK